MDTFPGLKMKAPPAQADILRATADQMHFDAPTRAIVEGAVPEVLRIYHRVEFIAQALQQVEIELRGDPSTVIVGRMQYLRVLLEVYADQ